MRRVKKPWLVAMLVVLAHQALYGASTSIQVRAARTYFDITLGKPRKENSDENPRFSKIPYYDAAYLPKFTRGPK
jgi:hypothetical protein